MKSAAITQPMVLAEEAQVVCNGREGVNNHGANPIYVTVCGVALSAVLISGSAAYHPVTEAIYHQSISVSEFGASESSKSFNSPQLFDNTHSGDIGIVDWEFSDESVSENENTMEQPASLEGVLHMINREVPIPFIACGGGCALLTVICAYAFLTGIKTGSFVMKPLYLLEFMFGFLGLTITVVVAIVEWRMKRGWKKRKEK